MNDAFMLACPLSQYLGGKRFCRWCNEPLAGRRTRWCSDECAKDAVSQHWFREASHAVRTRDNHACTKCRRSTGILHVHHIEPARGRHSKTNCVHHQDNLVVLCSDCHKAEHAPRCTA